MKDEKKMKKKKVFEFVSKCLDTSQYSVVTPQFSRKQMEGIKPDEVY